MSFDAHKNFAITTVATAPSPATSGTSLVVAAGKGADFPAVPFNATVWPTGVSATNANAEIVRVTAISTDTFTITRATESTSARTVIVGDQIAATITVKTLTDVEFTPGTGLGVSGTQFSIDTAITVDKTTAQTLTNKTLTSPVINTPTGIVKDDVGLGNVDNTADSAKTFSGAAITSGTVADARIDSAIARDSEVAAAYQPLDGDLTTIAGLTATTDNMIQSVSSAWASRTPTQVKTALGLTVGTDVQAYDADLATIAGLTATTDNMIQSVGSAWASRTPTQVKSALGLTIGTNVQAWDADLDTIAGLTATTDNFVVSVSSAWASRTPAQVRTTLGLVIGTNVQAYDADLTTYAGITPGALGQAILPMTTLTNHGVVIGQAGSAPVATTAGTTDYPLVSNGASADPAFEQLSLTTAVQGTLPVANGGTNRTTIDDGWITDPAVAWTYASATSIIITANANLYMQKGTKISWNDGSVKYGVVASIGAYSGGFTTITLVPNSDYAAANSSMSATRYSYAEAPFGFPASFGFSPTYTGYSADPTSQAHQWSINGGMCTYMIRDGANGTSNAATITMTVPIVAKTVTNGAWHSTARYVNSGGGIATTLCYAVITSAGTTVGFGIDFSATGGFGATLGKRIVSCVIIYPIA